MMSTFGITNYHNSNIIFGISREDRRRHMYMVGKSGSGKSKLLELLINQDIEQGHGVAVLDPHGDLVDDVLRMIPEHRKDDVILFDPSDIEFPIALNLLENVGEKYKMQVTIGFIQIFKKLFGSNWTDRLEHVLRYTILALLDSPNTTVFSILKMLTDKNYRQFIVRNIQDDVVKNFWVNEFAGWSEKFDSEAITPLLNKVGQFVSTNMIRNIVGQPKNTFDIRKVMDNQKILLINASKGRIGEDNSALLGAMLITRIQLAAMDRAKIPEEERKDFYLYVDEFQNFATESFASILSEARKYRLNLTIAHQYITQMEEPVRDAVFGNAGTLVTFRVGAADAEYLEKEFAPTFTETDLVNLDKYNAYIKLMIDGITSKSFSMQTIAPSKTSFQSREVVLKVSRERYGHERKIVEDKIARWSGIVFTAAAEEGRGQSQSRPAKKERSVSPSPLEELPSPEKAEQQLEEVANLKPREEITDLRSLLAGKRDLAEKKDYKNIACARCGKDADVPFTPEAGRPVYCRECFVQIREERKIERMKLGPPKEEAEVRDWQGPKRSEERRVGKECRSRWSPYH